MGDEFWESVTLLLHFDGVTPAWQADSSDFANDITTVTNSFGVAIGFGVFTDSAGRGGTGLASSARIPNSAGFVFDGDFTVEGFAYRAQTVGVQGILNFGGTTGSNRSWATYYNGDVLFLELSTSGAAAAITMSSGAVSEDVWHHIAFDRSGVDVRLYVDGIMVDKDTLADPMFASTAELIFGALNGTNAGLQLYMDEWRITKGVARYADDAGFTPPVAPYPEGLPPETQAPERVSQHAMLVLAELQSNPQVSQHAMLVLAEMATRDRVSQHAMLVLASYEPCLTKRAQLWRIERTDGVVLAFTSHDRPITYGADTYSPCDSLNASASETSADVEGIANVELTGIISDEGITEEDVTAGKFDDAYIQVFLVSWAPVDDGIISVDSVRRLNAGWAGTLSAGERGFKAEVMGPGAKLAQKSIMDTVTPGCRFEFGDENCGKDIDALKLSAEVSSVQDNGEFEVTVTDGSGVATYDEGFVRWLNGRNIGTDTEIKSIEFYVGGASIVLWAPAPFLPAVGDDVEIFPGCQKSPDACKTYDNFSEFGGFPDVPGTDALTEAPEAKY
jgi:uncharacterized phage protein (TIGR02218 family)